MPWNELGYPVTGWDGAGAGWDAPELTGTDWAHGLTLQESKCKDATNKS